MRVYLLNMYVCVYGVKVKVEKGKKRKLVSGERITKEGF